MKIKEVSEKTGLTKKTIRFYEAQKLFQSETSYQKGREFHEYSEDNVRQLLRIATLRRARFSVDEIRRMQETPEETSGIFKTYRERLREEKRDLEEILKLADAIPEEEIASADDLISRMEAVASELPLPLVDIHPRFRYLDQLEETYSFRKKKLKMTEEELKQHRIAAEGAVMYSAFSVQNSTSNNMAAGGKGGGFDISPAQKIAAYNLLMNYKDEDK